MAHDAWSALSLICPAKFYGPHPSSGWVERRRLLTLLDTHAAVRLILISAAAGFGKTVLVSQWLTRRQPLDGWRAGRATAARVAWLSLDPTDSAPVRLFSAVVAALERTAAGACPQTRSLLRASAPPSPEVLVDTLVAELVALDMPIQLVLDDLHTISDSITQQALAALIERMPDTLRLVITTRTPPPWPLERWRAAGQLLELDSVDLAFTPDEVRELIARSFHMTLDEQAVAALHTRTEGWVAGVQLIGTALQATDHPTALAARLHSSDRQLIDYLLNEVLICQPDPIQQLLLASAVTERFCAPLCVALLTEAGVDGVDVPVALHYLQQHQLFLVALDSDGGWFRYQQLFREVLLHRLRALWGEHLIQRLVLCAGRWCAAEGLVDQAIGYLLEGGAPEAAAALVEAQLHPMLDSGATIEVLSERLGRIPESTVQERPGLLVARAYLHCHVWDTAALPRLLRRAVQLLQQPHSLDQALADTLRGDVALLQTFVAYWSGNPARTLAHGRRALNLLPETHRYARGMALAYYAAGLELAGRREEGLWLLADTLADTSPDDLMMLIWLLNGLSALRFHKGDLEGAAAAAQRLCDLIQGTLYEAEAIGAPHMLGVIAYERNQLAVAEAAFTALARMRHRANARVALDGLHGLALVALARGDLQAAAALIAEASTMAQLLGSPYYRQIDDAATAWLAWRRGDQMAALRRCGVARWGALPPIDCWMIVPQRVRMLLLVQSDVSDVLAAVEEQIANGLARAEQIGSTRRLVELLTLRALARAAQDDLPAARLALTEALRLAEPCGLLRTFVDHGPALLPLLEALAQETHTGYVQHVLAAYDMR